MDLESMVGAQGQAQGQGRGRGSRDVHSRLGPSAGGAGSAPGVCHFWMRGSCRKGASCEYAHPALQAGAGSAGGAPPPPPGVCRFFVQGNCRKGDGCEFIHPGATPMGPMGGPAGAGPGRGSPADQAWPRSGDFSRQGGAGGPQGSRGAEGSGGRFASRRRERGAEDGAAPVERERWGRQRVGGRGDSVASRGGHVAPPDQSRMRTKPCKQFLAGECSYGDSCKFLHSHSTVPELRMVGELKGPPDKIVRAIAFPEGGSTLYSGAQDGRVRIWDCSTGVCSAEVDMGADVGALLAHSGWLFIGIPNQIRTWVQSSNEQDSLAGPAGTVHALDISGDLLFAACQDGQILCWKFNGGVQKFEPFMSLMGHSKAAVCISTTSDPNRLVSGSIDHSIKFWDLSVGQCVQSIAAHEAVVMGVVSWREFLISCALDGSVKVWGPNSGTGQMEMLHSHSQAQPDAASDAKSAAYALAVTTDKSGGELLLVAYSDASVCIYDLPSFNNRGSLFSRREVRCIHVSQGLIFTGDASGSVKVWSWA